MNRLAQNEGVNEALKRDKAMGWVARMNAIKAQAEEIIVTELICK